MKILFDRIDEQKLRDSGVNLKLTTRSFGIDLFLFRNKIPSKRSLFLWFVSFGRAKEMNI